MIRSLIAVLALAAALLSATAPPGVPAALAARGATPATSIDKEVIRRVVRKNTPALRRCYQQALAKQPGLVGRMFVRFTITPSGRVSSAVVVESTLQNPEMEVCVLRVIHQMLFPTNRVGNLIINYPFVFNSTF
jgi:TonB family protein